LKLEARDLLPWKYGETMNPTKGESVLANQVCTLSWVSRSCNDGLGRNVGCEWYHPTTSRPTPCSCSLASVCDTASKHQSDVAQHQLIVDVLTRTHVALDAGTLTLASHAPGDVQDLGRSVVTTSQQTNHLGATSVGVDIHQ
jgi:hypothetical protein